MSKLLTPARIHEEQWVARYVAGRLTETENEVFEEYCLANPAMVDEVEVEKRMKAALAVTSRPVAPLIRARPQRYWAIAASVVLAVCVGAALYLGSGRPQVESVLASLETYRGDRSLLEEVRLAEMRSSRPMSLGAASNMTVILQLTGRFEPEALYDASLIRTHDNASIASIDRLKAISDSEIRVLLDATRLEPGDYSLLLREKDTGAAQEFGFTRE